MENVLLASVLGVILTQMPIILILLIGLIIAIVRWKKHPRVSIIFCVIFGIEILINLPEKLIISLIPYYISQNHIPIANLAWIYPTSSILSTVISAVVWILIIIALFAWRTAPLVPDQNHE